MRHVVFLHGFMGDKDTYGGVPKLLAAEGYAVKHLHLGRYQTSRPELGVDDYADLLERRVAAGELGSEFDIIVHSTGALVVRAWLSRYYPPGVDSGLRNFIMAAPANNGSRLARWGQRVPTDWSESILRDLRLAAAHTWDLNWEWINNQRLDRTPNLKVFHLQGLKHDIAFPWLLDVVDDAFNINVPAFEERGSDTTVRFAAANLNMRAVRIGVGKKMPRSHEKMPRLKRKRVPIYTFPSKSHFGEKHGVLGSVKSRSDKVFQCILGILIGAPPPIKNWPRKITEYAMLVVRAVDQHGNPFPDFRLQFYTSGGPDRDRISIVHRSENRERDCYFLRFNQFASLRKLGFRIPAHARGKISYEQSQPIDLHWPAKNVHYLRPGITHFIEIAVKRTVASNALTFTSELGP